MPGWYVDAPTHMDRFCRETVRPMLVPNNVSAVRLADAELAEELWNTSDAEIQRLWPRVRGPRSAI